MAVKFAECPFFSAKSGTSIVCESIIPGAVLRHNFDHNCKAKTDYFTAVCCGDYKKCDVYKALERIYEEGRR